MNALAIVTLRSQGRRPQTAISTVPSSCPERPLTTCSTGARCSFGGSLLRSWWNLCFIVAPTATYKKRRLSSSGWRPYPATRVSYCTNSLCCGSGAARPRRWRRRRLLRLGIGIGRWRNRLASRGISSWPRRCHDGGSSFGGDEFLFTDVEGSTRRWENDADAMRAALAAHDEVLRNAIEARGGCVQAHG